MIPILFSFLFAIVIGIFLTIFSIACSIKPISSIFFGVLISDLVLLILYVPDMISGNNNTDINYVLLYIILGLIIALITGLYTLIRNNSHRCICKCCRKYSYLHIPDSTPSDD